MNFFTADLHLGHKNIMTYCNRPFKDVEEMNESIFNELSIMNPGDNLYVIGDLTFRKNLAVRFFDLTDKLGVDVYFVFGNHDQDKDNKRVLKVIKDRSKTCAERLFIRVDGQGIVLDHFAGRVWRESHFGSWQLYGHTHGKIGPRGKQYDVGIDNNDFELVAQTRIVDIMKTLPENENFIPLDKRRKRK